MMTHDICMNICPQLQSGIFVVSSSHASPMEQFASLTQQQHQQQHQQPNKLPHWFCPNVLNYYVLIHDVAAEDLNK